MRIGILGSGLMGGKLGTLFARAGHEVIFSYARSKEKLTRLAHDAKGKAKAGTQKEAAQHSEVLLLAVHWSKVDDVLKQAGDVSGKVIISCSLPMDAANTELIVGLVTSGAEELARKVPGAEVVSAFNNIPSEVLFSVFEARGKATPPSLTYCGDNERANNIVATLIRELGFDPVDLGSLQNARYTEPMAMIIAHLAYDGAEGPELVYRFEQFGN